MSGDGVSGLCIQRCIEIEMNMFWNIIDPVAIETP
jgi:hypothetical protein